MIGKYFQEISANSHYLGGQRTDMGWKEEILIFFASSLTNSYLLDRYGVEEER